MTAGSGRSPCEKKRIEAVLPLGRSTGRRRGRGRSGTGIPARCTCGGCGGCGVAPPSPFITCRGGAGSPAKRKPGGGFYRDATASGDAGGQGPIGNNSANSAT